MTSKVLVWDLETKLMPGDGETHDEYICRCGISVAAVWNVVDSDWTLYGHQDLDALSEELESADRVVGYNSIGFDHLVLDAAVGRRVVIQDEVDLWRDIQASMGEARWPTGTGTLDAVSRRTLGRGKSGSGSEAPELYASGRWAELSSYCIHDVDLTRELWEFMERFGYVIGPMGMAHLVLERHRLEGQPYAVVEPGVRKAD